MKCTLTRAPCTQAKTAALPSLPDTGKGAASSQCSDTVSVEGVAVDALKVMSLFNGVTPA